MKQSPYTGREYRSFDGMRSWELLHEGQLLVIIESGQKRGSDCNLLGFSARDLLVKWSLGGVIDSENQYDGIVNVWMKDGHFWAGTWSGFARRFDPQTGEVLEDVFTK
jgi:hypothetical protein